MAHVQAALPETYRNDSITVDIVQQGTGNARRDIYYHSMPYSKSTKGRPEAGRFMKKIDAALYLGRAAGLYQQLISSEAAILAHLQTGKTFLKGYLHMINASETAACECRLVESIPHFLFSCRRWAQQRAKLRQQHGERSGD